VISQPTPRRSLVHSTIAPAHLAGIGVGGMVAQIAALDHPEAFAALPLAGTRPVAPGRQDKDLPDHDAAAMKRQFSRSMPRAAVAQFAADGAKILGDHPAAARATAEAIWDRTPGTEPAIQMANQMGMVFSKLDCKPRWRKRLPELAVPTRGCSFSTAPRPRFPVEAPVRSPLHCSSSK
jgi:pimeloyl-ACP methyl ester carboxylesterase